MDGILNILKPPGMTSFDVVGYLRGVLKIKKIGHTGTLDPEAVGVLPICIGNATKAIEFMIEKDKFYRAELTLGVETDTQDAGGQVLNTREVTVSEEQIRETIAAFKGKMQQIPPMYSAVKINGKRLYELAREGKTVERTPRDIEVYSIDIKDIKDNRRVLFDVSCSKGTYIRTICADIGERLGCGGHMSFLIRLKAGTFDISNALTLEEVSELAGESKLTERLISVEQVFKGFDEVRLNGANTKRFLNGVAIKESSSFKAGEIIRVYDENERFTALGTFVQYEDNLKLKSYKLFNV